MWSHSVFQMLIENLTSKLQETAFKIASHITHPVTAAVFVAVIALVAFRLAYRAKKTRLAVILATGIILLGLAPIAASTFLQVRGLYRVRILVLGQDGIPVNDARVTSSIGGEPKKVENGWEFDIPPQTRPLGGDFTVYASVDAAFLSGTSRLQLGQDYYPTVTIRLTADTSAVIRGVVLDEHHRPVAGAIVSVAGYGEEAHSDAMGNFELPAHAANNQIVQISAQKDKLVGTLSVPAGRPIAITIHR